MKSFRFKIDGMSCAHCLAAVREAVDRVDGADVSKIDLESATITSDGGPERVAAVRDAITGAGYTVRSVEEVS